MGQHSRTKDERFILKMYEVASKTGDIEFVVNRYEIGRSIGMQEKGVDTICVLLGQANFIKKAGKEEIFLTPQGEQLALRLLDEG